MSVDPTAASAVLDRVAHGIAVLTTIDDDGRPHGMTISSLGGASAEPPTVLMCVRNTASMRSLLSPGRALGISVLGSHQAAVSAGFAYGVEDPFAAFAWHPDGRGVPIVDGTAGYLGCTIARVIDNHDTAVVIAGVDHAEVFGDDGLVYWMKHYREGLTSVAQGRW